MPLPHAANACSLALTLLRPAAPPPRAQAPAAGTQDGVARVETERVQTEAMVFDKEVMVCDTQGAFVDGRAREQFELKARRPTSVTEILCPRGEAL